MATNSQSVAQINSAKNKYEVLGVSQNATPAEIRKAYRAKVLEAHPDKNGNSPESNAAFIKLQDANETLSNPAQRSTYDKSLPSQTAQTNSNPAPKANSTAKMSAEPNADTNANTSANSDTSSDAGTSSAIVVADDSDNVENTKVQEQPTAKKSAEPEADDKAVDTDAVSDDSDQAAAPAQEQDQAEADDPNNKPSWLAYMLALLEDAKGMGDDNDDSSANTPQDSNPDPNSLSDTKTKDDVEQTSAQTKTDEDASTFATHIEALQDDTSAAAPSSDLMIEDSPAPSSSPSPSPDSSASSSDASAPSSDPMASMTAMPSSSDSVTSTDTMASGDTSSYDQAASSKNAQSMPKSDSSSGPDISSGMAAPAA